jgi:hypothetical protein
MMVVSAVDQAIDSSGTNGCFDDSSGSTVCGLAGSESFDGCCSRGRFKGVSVPALRSTGFGITTALRLVETHES